MLQQIETPWREGYNFGVGVDPGGGSPLELVVQQTPSPPAAPGGSLKFVVTRTRTTSDLQDTLKISAEATGGCGLFSASARFDFVRDCKVQSESLFMTVNAVADNAFQSIDDAVLTPDAAAHAADPRAFQERFGSVFVRGLRTGGLFVGVVQVESSSKDTQEKVGGEISASYAAFEAKISASHDTKDSSTNETYNAFLYFEGGDRAAIINVFDQTDPRTLFAAAKIWAATVGANGVPYHVTLAPIAIARGGPEPPDPAQLQLAQDVLTECTRQRASLLDGLNRIDYVLAHESLYGFGPDTISAQDLAHLGTDFGAALTQVAKCASVAIQHPENAVMPAAMPAIPGNMPGSDPALHHAFAAKGQAIANANPMVLALRVAQPDGEQRTGFDEGMGIWALQTLPGPGKTAFSQTLTPVEALGFSDAAAFSFAWNNNAEHAAQGAAISGRDPEVLASRTTGCASRPTGLPAAMYWLGFDVATGIYGDPALGGDGNTLIGPGGEKIRASLMSADGTKGFNDALAFNVGRRR
jgi:hypothetical protein